MWWRAGAVLRERCGAAYGDVVEPSRDMHEGEEPQNGAGAGPLISTGSATSPKRTSRRSVSPEEEEGARLSRRMHIMQWLYRRW